MRRKLIAGNWKMNTDRATAVALAEAVVERAGEFTPRRSLGLPAVVYLVPVGEVVKGTPVALGAQNMYHEAERRVHRRDQRRDAATTSAARTSSSATASGGTSWARPTRT